MLERVNNFLCPAMTDFESATKISNQKGARYILINYFNAKECEPVSVFHSITAKHNLVHWLNGTKAIGSIRKYAES